MKLAKVKNRPGCGQAIRDVVVIGAGFGGLAVVKALANQPIRVTLIDRRNHHLFQPLLYQVASAALGPSDIAYPIRSIFRRQKNVRVVMGSVVDIDRTASEVTLDDGKRIRFDRLVVATGATHSYFGRRREWAPHAPGLKTIEDALEIRRRVLSAFERAERYPEQRDDHLTFAVVGAGPTGVELAGALVEIALDALRDEFQRIDPASTKVYLIEGGDHVLGAYPEKLSIRAREQLETLGVRVRTGRFVSEIDDQGVTLDDGDRIPARTVLWAAGVRASSLGRTLDAALDATGRVKVEDDCSVPGSPEVFVIGDLAHVRSGEDTVPGVAPAAIQAGRHAARQIERDLAGRPREPFTYRDKGSLATIGRARGVAHLGRLQFGGMAAWLVWMAIHVAFLVGYRNRLFVLLSWAWNYVTFRRGARLITGGARSDAEASHRPAGRPQRPTRLKRTG